MHSLINRLRRRPISICGEIFGESTILSTGEVVCGCVDPLGINPLGNINQQSIKDIFYGDKYRSLRDQILSSSNDSFCPALSCDCCFKTLPAKDVNIRIPVIKKLTIETTSFCNLRCLDCSVPRWMSAKSPRLAKLDHRKIERAIMDTRDDLQQISLYNYGEPFLDHDLIPLLRFIRQKTKAWIYIHTNGTIMAEGVPEIIAREQLIHAISFSIDGTYQESYERYRIGGDFEKAFNNMISIHKYKNIYKNQYPTIIWQYILFDWNDSEEEIKRVQELAEQYQLDVLWVATHSVGASKKYAYGSQRFKDLPGAKTFR